MVVWRNPRRGQGHWGLDDYLGATLRAIDVVRAITGADDVNLVGLCAGGVTNALLLGYLAARDERVVHSATQLVTMLDSREPNIVGALSTHHVLETLRRHAEKGTVYDRRIIHNFAWLRPNDLVYGYLVHDWLLGNEPPEFDVLAWNSDSTRVSCAFLRDTFELLAAGRERPGQLRVLDTAIDLSDVRIDTFHIAGQRDHISRWRACYLAGQLFGGDRTMVLTRTGHILSLVSPEGAARYDHRVAPISDGERPDEWLNRAAKQNGSWWPTWIRWLVERSGEERPAPAALGSADHPAGDPAPGSYVLEA